MPKDGISLIGHDDILRFDADLQWIEGGDNLEGQVVDHKLDQETTEDPDTGNTSADHLTGDLEGFVPLPLPQGYSISFDAGELTLETSDKGDKIPGEFLGAAATTHLRF